MTSDKTASEREKEGIKKIHKKIFFAFILFILFLPSIGLIDILFNSDMISVSFALVYMGFFGWLFLSINLSKCPRCRKMYFYSSWPSSINKCSNCGLSIKEINSK